MPEIDYSKENVKVSKANFDFPKFSLKKDEKARILLIEKSPVFEWVHELKRPKMVDGEPVFEMTTPLRGEPRRVHTMDFLSRPICLGDSGVLEDAGLDDKNCPMCALAKRNPEATSAPVRRFATHIIRYKTKGATFTPLNPFTVEVLVWSFTERMFGQLAEFKEEWTDMRAHDLLVECTNQQFQNYSINVAKDAAWLESDDRKELVKAVYAGGRIEDLSVACGRQTERRWIDLDIQKIEEAWAEVAAFNRGTLNQGSLKDDLDGIANDTFEKPEPKAEPAAPKAASKPVDTSDLDDMFDGIETAPAKEVITDEPAVDEDLPQAAEPAAPAPAKAAPAADVADDLDALLGV